VPVAAARRARGQTRGPGPAADFFGYRRVGPEEKTRLVREHFTTIARRYDLTNTVLSLGLHHRWKRAAVGLLRLAPGERVIDVCGGTGDLALIAARAVGVAGRVVVYDVNRDMLEAGQAKLAAARAPLDLVEGDAENIGFPDASFDAALVGFGIRNVTRHDRALREMVRVLRPGGRLLCLEFSQPRNRLFRRLYDWYSFAVMPLAGRILAGSPHGYRYLSESIRTFPSPQGFAEELAAAGLTGIAWRAFSDGIAVAHTGTRA
jgi:demethylmenaquinone methyltransferase/2-methoxy-6-polyprenyl-1,4-benzoquinol methylase